MRHFVEMLAALSGENAEFLLVGGYALAAYGAPRATGDFDIWVRPTPENAERVYRALVRFGAPLKAHGVNARDFCSEGNVYQIGLPPQRIDLVTSISGIDFDTAWGNRVRVTFLSHPVDVMSRTDFIRNKRASGRPKDLADVIAVEDVMRAEAQEEHEE